MEQEQRNEELVKYVEGRPKQYKANCSGAGGFVEVNGTKVKGTFSFTPIALRYCNDALFNDKEKGLFRDWLEIYFVDKGNALSVLRVHNSSRRAFERLVQDSFYGDGTPVSKQVISLTFKEKTAKTVNGDVKYFVCQFEAENLAEDEITPPIKEFISMDGVHEFKGVFCENTITETSTENIYFGMYNHEAAELKQSALGSASEIKAENILLDE